MSAKRHNFDMGSKRVYRKLIERKRRRMAKLARKNRAGRRASDLFLITDPKLFDKAEGTFVDYSSRKRVNVYLVPASWSRVIVMSLVYAFFLSLVKYVYFSVAGKPALHQSAELLAESE